MPKKHPNQDRSFDGLASKFTKNIYDSPKGQLRLEVLKRDFGFLGGLRQQSILDVGAGQGQFAVWAAEQGAQLSLVDSSEEMLSVARVQLAEVASTRFIQADLWQLSTMLNGELFDVVVNHAVLEWLERPFEAIGELSRWVKPEGHLSLLFYNVHGLVFKNLLRTNYKKVVAKDFRGQRGSLTPLNPLDPSEVVRHIGKLGYQVICHSGVRVFHDYLLDREKQQYDLERVFDLELEYSQQDPYRGLGRYVHLLLKKTSGIRVTKSKNRRENICSL